MSFSFIATTSKITTKTKRKKTTTKRTTTTTKRTTTTTKRTTTTTKRTTTKTTTRPTTPTYSTVLSESNGVFSRPHGWGYSFYVAIRVTVSQSGLYTFRSNNTFDTVGYLYSNSFSPSSPTTNLLAENDMGVYPFQLQITAELQSTSTAILVVTNFRPGETGAVTVRVTGPGATTFVELPKPIASTYSTVLSESNGVFSRPHGGGYSFYVAIRVTVSQSGLYTFRSNNTFDTVGYLYSNSFSPSSPTTNLLAENDMGVYPFQLQITTELQSTSTAILVVTNFRPGETGAVTVRVTGPGATTFVELPKPIASTYSTVLSESNGVFSRPHGWGYSFYVAIRVTVSQSGLYTFRSNNTFDTVGSLYSNSFSPSSPTTNLLAEKDMGVYPFQLQITAELQSTGTVILVVTNARPDNTGAVTVRVMGPSAATFVELPKPITSTYSTELSESNGVFARPGGWGNSFYVAIRVTVSQSGLYTFRSNNTLDTVGYLYNNSFSPSSPSANLLAQNDMSANPFQLQITAELQFTGTVILVVTNARPDNTGAVTVRVTGPSAATFVELPKPITSTYSTELSESNGVFARPGGWGNSFYVAIRVTVSQSGLYTFRSSNTLDTVGYLYNNSFSPSSPSANLLAQNDMSANPFQLQITAELQFTGTVILVVTNARPDNTGAVTVRVTGPGAAIFSELPKPIAYTYSTILSDTNGVFARPGGWGNSFYVAIRVSVSQSGLYIFRSNDSFDTAGYLYRNSFSPSSPSTNLLAQNDMGAYPFRLQIEAELQSTGTTILVVTSYRAGETGAVTVRVTGPGAVTFSVLPKSRTRGGRAASAQTRL